ncbi:MAG: hypothetical protein ACOCXQ_03880, partial [Patescibacteria group bacterium]
SHTLCILPQGGALRFGTRPQIFLLGFFMLMAMESYIFAFLSIGLTTVFWWYSYHYYFIDKAGHKHLGKEMGFMELLYIVASSIAPLVGGLILTFANEVALYVVAGILIVGSMAITYLMDEATPMKQVRFRDIFRQYRRWRNDGLAFIGSGAEEIVYLIVWPLFLYFTFGDILSIGIFYAFVIALVALLNLGIGAAIDQSNAAGAPRL